MVLESTAGGLAFLLGRLVFGTLLGFMGLSHFTGLDGMSGYAETQGVPVPRLAIWLVDDPEQRQAEMTHFLKNVTLFGAALVFVALSGTIWPYALSVGL